MRSVSGDFSNNPRRNFILWITAPLNSFKQFVLPFVLLTPLCQRFRMYFILIFFRNFEQVSLILAKLRRVVE
jgi:hypothetical protein